MVRLDVVLDNDTARELMVFLKDRRERAVGKIVKTNRAGRQLDDPVEDHLTKGMAAVAQIEAQLHTHFTKIGQPFGRPARKERAA